MVCNYSVTSGAPKTDISEIYEEQSLCQWLLGRVVGIDVLHLMLFLMQLLPVLLIQNHPHRNKYFPFCAKVSKQCIFFKTLYQFFKALLVCRFPFEVNIFTS